MTDDLDAVVYRPPPAKLRPPPDVNTEFEEVPTEISTAKHLGAYIVQHQQILNGIAAHLPDDHDLFSLSCSCSTFTDALVPAESATWKVRFLSRYDCTLISPSRLTPQLHINCADLSFGVSSRSPTQKM
jgi:hypothetical protein